MQIWSEQGLAWGKQEPARMRGWWGLVRWPGERSAEEQLLGRWAKLARQLDRECEQLRRRMERSF